MLPMDTRLACSPREHLRARRYNDGNVLSHDCAFSRQKSFYVQRIIIVAAACVVAYFLRRNFRRAWYVLRTGDEHPDWEKLGGDYFIAPWERRGLKGPALNEEANAKRVSE